MELAEPLHDRLTVLVGIGLEKGAARVEVADVEPRWRADRADSVDRLVTAVAGSKHRLARLGAGHEGIAGLHRCRLRHPGCRDSQSLES